MEHCLLFVILFFQVSMVEIAWAEDIGQFLDHVDPDTRKITRRLKKI